MNKIVLSVAVLAAVALAFSGAAYATTDPTVHAEFLRVLPGVGVTVYHTGLSEGTQVGIYRFYAQTVVDPDLVLQNNLKSGYYFGTNCFETQNVSGGGWYDYTVYTDLTKAPLVAQSQYVNPEGVDGPAGKLNSTQVEMLRRLFARNANLLWYQGGTYDPPSLPDANNAVAIQLAVWEIAWEHPYVHPGIPPTYDVKSGSASFDIGDTYRDLANTMLGGLATPLSSTEAANAPPLFAFVNSSYQDQLWLIPGGGSNVPEPLTMLGMFLGLGSVGAYIRKRRMA